MAIITIGGNLGAGKTTLAGKLASALGYEELYVGGIFRTMAAEHGLSLEDFYSKLKSDPKLERSVDEQQAKLMQEKDNLVVQGRVAWFFAKESPFAIFNIFLAVDPLIGAARIAKREGKSKEPIADLVAVNTGRERTEQERYRTLYGVENFLELGHYDFALDTSKLTEQEVLDKILLKIKDRIGI